LENELEVATGITCLGWCHRNCSAWYFYPGRICIQNTEVHTYIEKIICLVSFGKSTWSS